MPTNVGCGPELDLRFATPNVRSWPQAEIQSPRRTMSLRHPSSGFQARAHQAAALLHKSGTHFIVSGEHASATVTAQVAPGQLRDGIRERSAGRQTDESCAEQQAVFGEAWICHGVTRLEAQPIVYGRGGASPAHVYPPYFPWTRIPLAPRTHSTPNSTGWCSM